MKPGDLNQSKKLAGVDEISNLKSVKRN